ncbi:chaplin family protein [Streptomyces crystallinus]|uniref:Chaplin domain-containing protein n=1 Tax=Streptomyces crystallinus TaxID=68191 RepID=A0ABN1FPF6_9ACTN
MTNTKKYVLAALVGTALTFGSVAPAMAADHGPDRGYGDHDDRYRDGSDRGECSNHGSAYAEGYVSHSPGLLSGNLIQIPINIPINICGNHIL